LVLYKIAKKLNIDVDLDSNNLILIEKIITNKKKQLSTVETSFLWLWVNEPNDDKKLELIKQFINKHG